MPTEKQRFLPTDADRRYGERLRLRRKELGLTQGELAKRVGLSLHTVLRYEKAKRPISLQAARRIEEVLGILATPGKGRATGGQLAIGVHSRSATMSPKERTLLAMFRALPDVDQESVLGRTQSLYADAAEDGRLREHAHIDPFEETDPAVHRRVNPTADPAKDN